jgi:hypothetical protein
MSHLGVEKHMLFLVVPKANEALQHAIQELPRIIGGRLKNRVRVLYLEDVMDKVELPGRAAERSLRRDGAEVFAGQA